MGKMISDPEDKNPGKGYKPEQLGSAIRVDGKPLKEDKAPAALPSAPDFKPKFDKAAADAMRDEVRSQGAKSSDAYKKGGMTASKRADGIAQRGKTKGMIV